MNITEHEVRGLLTGKCLPGDMRLNEELPAYLVRKFSELKAQRDALAAENAAVKSSRAVLAENTLEACNAIASAGFRNEAIMRGLMASTGNGNKYPKPITTLVDEALRKIETPAIAAYLNSVRESFVDEAIHALAASGAQSFGDCMVALNQLRAGEPS